MKFGLFMCLFLLCSAGNAMTCHSDVNSNKVLVVESFGAYAIGKIYPQPRGDGGAVMAGKYFVNWSADGSKGTIHYTFYNQEGELVEFVVKKASLGSGQCRAKLCQKPLGNTYGKLMITGNEDEYFTCF